ncbi:hypothetical protein P5673_017380 [Acropora cervicornis]|uniref:Uncharacterized protein n=1 Tax=Acropora cervicornis TaxID=6130 RepID=A0AAD9QEN5_ACRCE|nr:hypothetical protein P5673_017380 [Acropora cervicornis]
MLPARDRTFKIISDATSTTIIERLRELKPFLVLFIRFTHSRITVYCCQAHGHGRNVNGKHADESMKFTNGVAINPFARNQYSST